MANVLLLNGSPHAHGAIDLALTKVAQTLQECGLTTEIVHIGQQDIRGCIACGRCGVLHHCAFDDAVNALAPKFEAADALIVGSPVYYASANGTLTNLPDRLFYSTPFDKTSKGGAAVVSCRRGGASATFDQLNKYFTIAGMPVASSQYWNSIHGNNAQEAAQDAEGLQVMRTLGRNVAFLVICFVFGLVVLGLFVKVFWFWKGSHGAAGEGETGRDEFHQINRIIAKKVQGVMFLEPFCLFC